MQAASREYLARWPHIGPHTRGAVVVVEIRGFLAGWRPGYLPQQELNEQTWWGEILEDKAGRTSASLIESAPRDA